MTNPPDSSETQPSLAFRCPQCHFEAPEVDVEHNPSTDRWLKCPACGHRWNVSPIADSN